MPAITRNQPGTGDRILGLEILRFVAALAVLVWHYQHFSFFGGIPVDFVTADQPFFKVLKPLYIYGYFGVQCFWCISGYIFFWKYRNEIASGVLGARSFFILRFSRLYPLHLVTLLLVAGMQLAHFRMNGVFFVYQANDWPHFLLQLGLATDWLSTSGYSFNGPIWSISLEVLVYALFFVSLRWLGTSPIWTMLFALGSYVAIRLGLTHQLFECILFFHLGGLVAVLADHPLAERYKRAGLWLAVAAGLGVLLWLALRGKLSVPGKIRNALMLWAPLAIYIAVVHVRLPARWHAMAHTLGNMTYASYLIHFPLQLACALLLRAMGLPVPYGDGWFFAGYIALVLALSVPVFRWIERPAQEAIRRALIPPAIGRA